MVNSYYLKGNIINSSIADYVYSLLNKAQREFHDMFTRTYGVIYQKNAHVFQNYFKDLKVYYDKGNLSPADSTSSFFNSLYQKMFQVNLLELISIWLCQTFRWKVKIFRFLT